jgi:hypothetical protein
MHRVYGSAMAAAEYPRLVNAFPELVTEIVELLRADGDDALAGVVGDLRYFGRCTCSPTCLLTSPRGSPCSFVAELERNADVVMWPWLDATATTVTHIEIIDGRNLCPASRRPR